MIEEDNAAGEPGSAASSDSLSEAIQPYAGGASAFISRACPAASEEIGLAFRGRMGARRAVNLAKILDKANQLLLASNPESEGQIHPRLIHPVLEDASWCEEGEIQGLWAGLLLSGTSPNGASDENLIYMNLLKQLSSLEVRLLSYGAIHAKKQDDANGLVQADNLMVTPGQLMVLFEGFDLPRLDRELEHLKAMGLVQVDEQKGEKFINVAPTSLGLNLYIRAQGSKYATIQFFNERPAVELFPGQDFDPELKGRLENMAFKLMDALATGIDKRNLENKFPPLEELKTFNLTVLYQLAPTAGITIPPPLAAFPLQILKPTLPLSGEPEWKKVIKKSEFVQLEKVIDEFAKKVSTFRGVSPDGSTTNLRSKFKPNTSPRE
jgi:hypothetical protein